MYKCINCIYQVETGWHFGVMNAGKGNDALQEVAIQQYVHSSQVLVFLIRQIKCHLESFNQSSYRWDYVVSYFCYTNKHAYEFFIRINHKNKDVNWGKRNHLIISYRSLNTEQFTHFLIFFDYLKQSSDNTCIIKNKSIVFLKL